MQLFLCLLLALAQGDSSFPPISGALTSDYASACGAYDEAVKRRPGKLITLRQKARVIKKSH